MKTSLKFPAALLCSFIPLLAHADEIRFTSCPIYRDTDAGRKSGCWLTDDHASGTRYDVSKAPTKPDWNYPVLVEGNVAATQDQACGGITLDPVRVSVLEGSCPRHLLPAESYPGRVFVLPKRNVQPTSQVRTPPPPPYRNSTFSLFFDFNSSFIVYQYDDYLLDQAITWIRAAQPRRIMVTGYADTGVQTVSGQKIAERAELAQLRAEKIQQALIRLGIDQRIIKTSWSTRPEASVAEGADGLNWPSRRRVDISAEL